MAKVSSDIPIFGKVLSEEAQGPMTREHLYKELEGPKGLGLPIVAYCTSFVYPAMIEDIDADMIEGILQKCDLSKGFFLLLSSPGGYPLAAERIINICKSYSGVGKYNVIVPSKAKSAATMICMGAEKIIMSSTSELGPIDPQIRTPDGGVFSAFNLIESYEELFGQAVKASGRLEPYIQQLSHYDAREIKEYQTAVSLSEDIAVKALRAGMMGGISAKDIKKKIQVFLNPRNVKDHGRAIYAKEAIKSGLKIEVKNVRDTTWNQVYELYYRLNNVVSSKGFAKIIECCNFSVTASVDQP